eukprot:CAMPEP_0174843924 /NCGR_PEP_ID=MMETSP1114-20130205/10815_1 /TAXON_ID=312471 /ORGANISM="Neobodo designis, Strain CCAP 1951/1" /LENGTH=697 /DNA_ID=CAMNT_0016078155 /DNA_START=43 /DNA_END=2136 /DNA_ORIENTATION=+
MAGLLGMLRSEGPVTAKEAMEGVTPTSNWIVPNLVLVGDAPRPGDSLEMLLDYGVECFVDLTPGASGACTPDASKYLSACTIELPDHVEYHGFDLNSVMVTPTTQSVRAAAHFLAGVVQRALSGEGRTTYIHCTDGAQVTAVAAVAVLGFVYNVSALKATTIVSQQYACRSSLAVQGSLFGTQLKTVCREVVAVMAPEYEKLPPLAAPGPSSGPAPSVDDEDHAAVAAPLTDVPRQPASSQHHPADRYAPTAGEDSPADATMQRAPPQPAATPSRPAPSEPSSHGLPAMRDDHCDAMLPLATAPPHQSGSPNRMKPSSMDSHALGGGAHDHQSQRPASRSGAVPGTPSNEEPYRRPGSRFAHSHGHGGGASSINLFGASTESLTNTPTRRGGRARVQNSPDNSPAQSMRRDPGASSLNQVGSWADAGTPSRFGQSVETSPAAAGHRNMPPPQQQQHQLHQPQQDGSAIRQRPQSAAAMSAASSPSALGHPTASTASSPAVPTAGSGALPPPLEPRKNPTAVAGPTPTSNWVIAGAVCCGARPVTGQFRPFAALAAQHFNAFVCLTEADSTHEYVPAYKQQSGVGDVATRHLPLKDGQMFKPAVAGAFFSLVEEVASNVENGSWRVYVHCAQGHGRTGLFVTALLWRLYGLPPMKAVNYCDALHSCRQVTEDQSSPQTQEQRTGIVSALQQRTERPPP